LVAAGFGGRVGDRLAAAGDGVHVFHELGKVVCAERIAFKGNFRRAHFDGVDNDFAGEH